MHLDRQLDGAPRRCGGEARSQGSQRGIDRGAGLQQRLDGVAAAVQVYPGVGKGVFDRLELSDGTAELFTFLGVADRQVQRGAGGAGQLGQLKGQVVL
ncbi:hypothetical protein D3C85_1138160 [compost metagenome]